MTCIYLVDIQVAMGTALRVLLERDDVDGVAERLKKNAEAMVYTSIPRGVRALSVLHMHYLSTERRRVSMQVEDVLTFEQKEGVLIGKEVLELIEKIGLSVVPCQVVRDKGGGFGCSRQTVLSLSIEAYLSHGPA